MNRAEKNTLFLKNIVFFKNGIQRAEINVLKTFKTWRFYDFLMFSEIKKLCSLKSDLIQYGLKVFITVKEMSESRYRI